MTIRHLPASGYDAQPWKNGTGTTDEICRLPEGASRDDFALRASRASITEPGAFSAFPGVDRVITLIEGEGLSLDFGDRITRLAPEEPFRFDSGLMPVGVPKGGPVRVVNVMARRSAWFIASARIVTGAVELPPDHLSVVFALRGLWRIGDATGTATLSCHDSAFCDAAARLAPEGAGAALLVSLTPAVSALR